MTELLFMCLASFCVCFFMVFGALAGGFCLIGLHDLWEKMAKKRRTTSEHLDR